MSLPADGRPDNVSKDALRQLCRRLVCEVELFDLEVCTQRDKQGRGIPVTQCELRAVLTNWSQSLQEFLEEATAMGYTSDEFRTQLKAEKQHLIDIGLENYIPE